MARCVAVPQYNAMHIENSNVKAATAGPCNAVPDTV